MKITFERPAEISTLVGVIAFLEAEKLFSLAEVFRQVVD
jgi:hypothetical protein